MESSTLSLKSMQSLGDAISAIGTSHFGDKLFDAASQIADADHLTVVSYSEKKGMTALLTTGVIPHEKAQSLSRAYEENYYLDPSFGKLANPPEADVEKHLHVPTESITNTDYRTFFFSDVGIVDKASLMLRHGDTTLLTGFYRIKPTPPFTEVECSQLEILSPLWNALIGRNFLSDKGDKNGQEKSANGSDDKVNRIIVGALPPFDRLSARERTVCECILMGLSAPEMSSEMRIAVSSIVTFRRRAYAKLGIRTRRDLFGLVASPAIANKI